MLKISALGYHAFTAVLAVSLSSLIAPPVAYAADIQMLPPTVLNSPTPNNVCNNPTQTLVYSGNTNLGYSGINCVPVTMTSNGDVAASGSVSVGSGLTVTGASGLNGGVSVTGPSTLKGSTTVTGGMAVDTISIGNTRALSSTDAQTVINLSNMPACNSTATTPVALTKNQDGTFSCIAVTDIVGVGKVAIPDCTASGSALSYSSSTGFTCQAIPAGPQGPAGAAGTSGTGSSGFTFGGMYSHFEAWDKGCYGNHLGTYDYINPVTGALTCPVGFTGYQANETACAYTVYCLPGGYSTALVVGQSLTAPSGDAVIYAGVFDDLSGGGPKTIFTTPCDLQQGSNGYNIAYCTNPTLNMGTPIAWSDAATEKKWSINALSLTSGQSNIQALSGVGLSHYPAAQACAQLTYGGYTDWYLPSSKELLLLYGNRKAIGGFINNAAYRSPSWWSSTGYSAYLTTAGSTGATEIPFNTVKNGSKWNNTINAEATFPQTLTAGTHEPEGPVVTNYVRCIRKQ